jgi:hypothetical protein
MILKFQKMPTILVELHFIAIDRSVSTGSLGAAPPRRGTPAPHPNMLGFSYN